MVVHFGMKSPRNNHLRRAAIDSDLNRGIQFNLLSSGIRPPSENLSDHCSDIGTATSPHQKWKDELSPQPYLIPRGRHQTLPGTL